jgi:hypothetical protein
MDGRNFLESVCDPQDGFLTLPKTQQRAWDRLVDGHGAAGAISDHQLEVTDLKV